MMIAVSQVVRFIAAPNMSRAEASKSIFRNLLLVAISPIDGSHFWADGTFHIRYWVIGFMLHTLLDYTTLNQIVLQTPW